MTRTAKNLSRRNILAGLAAVPALHLTGGLRINQAYAQTAATILNTVEIREPPMLLSLVSPSALKVSAKVTEGLLEFDHDLNPVPLLATSWEVSEDGLTYTFKLREGVKWHDGQPFTADDVEFSILTQKQHHPRGRQTFSQVREIEKPDPLTVILHLDNPTSYLLTALSSTESPVVPKHVYGDADPATHDNNTAPIGTGPFIFREWTRGSHIIWDRNPDYWDASLPRVERIVCRLIPDPAAVSVALENQTIDLAYRSPVPPRDLERLEQLPFIGLESRGYEYNPPNFFGLEFNLHQEKTANIPLRQAIAHAIDRDAITKVVYLGRALPTATPVVPLLKAFHNPNPSPYAFDPERAIAILDAAGFTPGADGVRAELYLDFTGEDRRLLAEFIKAALMRVGININLRGQDGAALVKRIYTDRDFDIHLLSSSNFFDPNVGVSRLFATSNIIVGVAYSNGSGYSNPVVDDLMTQASVLTDQAARIALWMQVQDILMTDVPVIPVVAPSWYTIYNTRVQDHAVDAEGYESSLKHAFISA